MVKSRPVQAVQTPSTVIWFLCQIYFIEAGGPAGIDHPLGKPDGREVIKANTTKYEELTGDCLSREWKPDAKVLPTLTFQHQP